MEDRNKLFRKAHALLVEEGADKEEARALVKETLRQGRRPSGGSSHNSGTGNIPGGGSKNSSGRGRKSILKLYHITKETSTFFS